MSGLVSRPAAIMTPDRPALSGLDTIFFLLFFVVAFAGIAIRAALVPLVHDEAASLFWYVERGEFLPYLSLWDANNHYLNSMLGIVAHELGGLRLWVIRSFNVLAFGLYSLALYRLGMHVHSTWVRRCMWAALLLCPFLYEFFGAFRGYGLCMAFWILALDGFILWLREERTRHLAQALAGLLLANASVPILLPVAGIAVAVIGMRLLLQHPFQRKKEVLIHVGLGIIPMLAGALLTWELRRRGLLYHGSTEGLLKVTVEPLVHLVTGIGGSVAATAIVALVAALVAGAFTLRHRPAMLLAGLLCGDLLLRVMAALVFEVNFPEDRAALHYVPLVVLLAALVLDRLATRQMRWRMLSTVLLLLPIRTLLTFNVDHMMLWPEQSIPAAWMHVIEEEKASLGRPPVIGAYHQLGLALPYMQRMEGYTGTPPESRGFLRADEDLRIVDHRWIDHARTGYLEVANHKNRLHLLKRDPRMRLSLIDQIEQGHFEIPHGLHLLWREEPDEQRPTHVALEGILDDGHGIADLYVIMLHEGDTIPRHEHGLSLRLMRREWSGHRLEVLKWVDPSLESPALYLWSPEKGRGSFEDLRITLYHGS
jgi:hypothetical protein